MPQRLQTPPRRAAARVVTGSAAHLYAGLVDWVLLVARLARARLARPR